MADGRQSGYSPHDAAAAPLVRILLVDDSPTNRQVIGALAHDLGLELDVAVQGEEAFRQAQTQEFAVVLLSFSLSGHDALATARRIRRLARARITPFIMLESDSATHEQIEEGYSLGVVDFLSPPLVGAGLRGKLQALASLFREKQAALHDAETLRLLVQGTVDYAIFMLDPTGKVITWNAGAERLKGYRAEEIIGQHFSRFYPQEAIDRDWPGEELRLARAQGRFEDEGWRLRKDGSRFWANVVITALRDEAGNLRGFSKITRDITERKEAEETGRRLVEEATARRVAEENARVILEQREQLGRSEQRFARFMQHLSGLAWIKDLHGRYVYANDAAVKAFNMPRSELYGKTDAEIFPPATAAQFRQHDQEALASGAGIQVVESLVHNDGVVRYSLVSKFPIPSAEGEAALVGGMAIDISEQRRVEEKLREADRRKDEFLATLAHELRNPLAPIRTSLQVLTMPRIDPTTAQETRDVMERQVQHLVRLVDDLLDVSRVMGGKIELRREPVEVATVIARAVETAKPMIEAQGHKFEISLPRESLLLDADPMRLAQVLSNLLTNSAKYTEPGGSLQIVARREENSAVISVADTGIGIEPEMLPHVFELFVQANHAFAKAQGGLGIGLTLVKSLVELHGGCVEARSAGLGHGSEFRVRLPLMQHTPHEPALVMAPSEPPFSRHRLLVVDDNRDAANMLATLLRLRGHEVEVAHDGAAAIAATQFHKPEIVFLDIGMPEMDGYEVARRIRKTPGIEHTVLAALTGWGQQADRRRTAEAGFNHHLVKPAEPQEIERLISQLPKRQ